MPAQFALPLLLTLVAPAESPRWTSPAASDAANAPITEARATLRALYTLRGALFQLRAELLAIDTGLDALAPVDAGLFAARLARPKNDLSQGPGLRQVVAAAWDAAPDAATARTLKATYGRLAAEPRLKAGTEVKSAPLDPGAIARAGTLAALARTAVVALETAAKTTPAQAKRLAPLAKKLAGAVHLGAPRDPVALAGLLVAPGGAVGALRPLSEDAAAADEVLAACAAELKVLGPALQAAWRIAAAPPDLAGLVARLPNPGFADPVAAALSSQALPRVPVPLDPDAVCRALWDASCARLTTCHGAIANVVMSPAVCEEGADALIEACRQTRPNGYSDPGVNHAALKTCLEAWAARPCESVCGKAAPAPPECERFAPGLAPVEVKCGAPGKLLDEENEDGMAE